MACTAGWWALACAAQAQVPPVVPAPTGQEQGASALPGPEAGYRLRVVGGAAGLSQYQQNEEPFWTQRLPQLSGGRYRAEIVPYDRAGVPSMEMLRLMELGVVPMGTLLLSALAAQYPQYMAPDLPGLNPDMATLRAHVAAFRPYLEQALREQHGVKVLAIYVYPAQVLFCKRPVVRLVDLKGRSTRVASPNQADFVRALGGVPVYKSFTQVMPSLESNGTECAITGTMSGHALGLYNVTSYLYPMPLSWALSVFAANEGTWKALPDDLRALLLRELPRLEQSIWTEAERETAEGIACNRGRPECRKSPKGNMAVMAVSPQDEGLRQQILETAVLRQWRQRCRIDCEALWRQTIAPVQDQRTGVP